MTVALILLMIIVPIAFVIVIIYNRLVRYKYFVQEAWSGVDVQLKRRSDLIPSLIDIIKGYVAHEKKLLNEVTEIRAKSMTIHEIGEKGQMENALAQSLARLFAVIEAYPDLKANQNFLDLQHQLGEIENQIQLSRRYYNGTVRNLNILIESFPSNLVATIFRYRKGEYFQIEDADRAVPKATF